ncbi:multiple antibiotic transporter [Rubidibacter lacunae KORDI 51-2]|uniref:UPF0056 membrane protein n=1 Tax=Rubidibacter lacunae KORDI 51-2 TaxID=582515 RepID=U5DLC4_9CHRO|nr:MarC family protein [Rubidibacter lacunae]ERN41379.1 multiple antibiotic transporter [Rubidibacter lacunae KORDI 51-2]
MRDHLRPESLALRHWRWIPIAAAIAIDIAIATLGATAIAQVAPDTVVQPETFARLDIEAIASKRNGFGLFNIFVIFLVTLGPVKILAPFAQLTAKASRQLRFQLALRSSILSASIIFFVAVIGQKIASIWKLRLGATAIASGLILTTGVLKIINNPPQPPQFPERPSLELVVRPLTFSLILTPSGIAIVLVVILFSHYTQHDPMAILGLLAIVLTLDFCAMLAARYILAIVPLVLFSVLSYTLSVFQLALGVSLILLGIEVEVRVLQPIWNSSP